MSEPESKAATAEEETRDQAWLCDRPCLLICHGTQVTLYDMSQNKHQTKASQEFATKDMFGSHGEWILARDLKDASDCCILNASTMEKFQVPALGEFESSTYSSFFLCGSPTADAGNCTMVVVSSRSDIIFYCKIGATELSKQDLELGVLYHATTAFQGKMYYIEEMTYTLICAQLQDSMPLELMECIPGFELKDQLRFCDYSYLVVSCDQLLFIHQHSIEMGVREFEIFGADLSKEVWEKVSDIGSDRAIFIDNFKGFSALIPPGSSLKGNCIYYMSEIDMDDSNNVMNLFRYDLENGFVKMLPQVPFKIHWKKPNGPDLIWINCSS